jgi:GH18 family chitinase
MTTVQSQQFGELVEALNNKFDGTSYHIMVTCLADPAYLRGDREGDYGFAKQVLANIANLSQVKSINLMTYNFYGAFNYHQDGTGRTGFLSDTYMPDNASHGSINFSAQESIETLLSLGVPAEKISGGIPAFGRALQAIDTSYGLSDPATGAYTGLYATILSRSFIPRSDLDDITCHQSIYPLARNSCSGSYSYAYIIKKLINRTFVTVDWKNNPENHFNATTAYTKQYNPSGGRDIYFTSD